MGFAQRVQAAVAAIQGKTTAAIDATEHQELLDTIGQLTRENQVLVNERDTAMKERDLALAALEGLAGTAPAEEEAPAEEVMEETPAEEEVEEAPGDTPEPPSE